MAALQNRWRNGPDTRVVELITRVNFTCNGRTYRRSLIYQNSDPLAHVQDVTTEIQRLFLVVTF